MAPVRDDAKRLYFRGLRSIFLSRHFERPSKLNFDYEQSGFVYDIQRAIVTQRRERKFIFPYFRVRTSRCSIVSPLFRIGVFEFHAKKLRLIAVLK